MFYTTFPENRHRSQLHISHLRENTVLCPDNVHIFHRSYDRRILRHILFNTNWLQSWNASVKNSVSIASTWFNNIISQRLSLILNPLRENKNKICDICFDYAGLLGSLWFNIFIFEYCLETLIYTAILICTKCFFQYLKPNHTCIWHFRLLKRILFVVLYTNLHHRRFLSSLEDIQRHTSHWHGYNRCMCHDICEHNPAQKIRVSKLKVQLKSYWNQIHKYKYHICYAIICHI